MFTDLRRSPDGTSSSQKFSGASFPMGRREIGTLWPKLSLPDLVPIGPGHPLYVDYGERVVDMSNPRAAMQPSQKLEGDLAFGLIQGGTSARVFIRNRQELRYIQLPNELFGQLPENANREVSGLCGEYMKYLAAATVRLLGVPDTANYIDPVQLKVFGVSNAGPVFRDPSGSTLVTTSNTPVHFTRFDIADSFLAAFESLLPKGGKLSLNRTLVENDARLAYEGERLHPQGGLYGVTDGAIMINGTGTGGDGFAPYLKELGHAIICKQTPFTTGTTKHDFQIEFRSVGLQSQQGGFSADGHFCAPSGYRFLEHIVAGPWWAVGFVKCLNEGERYALAQFLGIDPERIEELAELSDRHRPEWNRSGLRDSVVKPINGFLTRISSLVGFYAKEDIDILYQIVHKAHEYKRFTWKIFGEALGCILNLDKQIEGFKPPSKIVLLSGMVDLSFMAPGEPTAFIDTVRLCSRLGAEATKRIDFSLRPAACRETWKFAELLDPNAGDPETAPSIFLG